MLPQDTVLEGTEQTVQSRTCYVDAHELFPQATYYLDNTLSRPKYAGTYSSSPTYLQKKKARRKKKSQKSSKISSHLLGSSSAAVAIQLELNSESDTEESVSSDEHPSPNTLNAGL